MLWFSSSHRIRLFLFLFQDLPFFPKRTKWHWRRPVLAFYLMFTLSWLIQQCLSAQRMLLPVTPFVNPFVNPFFFFLSLCIYLWPRPVSSQSAKQPSQHLHPSIDVCALQASTDNTDTHTQSEPAFTSQHRCMHTLGIHR